MWALSLCIETSILAEELAESPATTAGDQIQSGETAAKFPAGDPEDSEDRRRARQLGVVMLGGIVILGIALLAFVLIWGNRVRRTARAPLPHVADRNELWYLKPARKEENNRGTAESGTETDQE